MSFCLVIIEKYDLKDRKILYELDINSRQSFRSIGRKVCLSKDVVASRVKKFKEIGLINTFFTVIDSSKLGYISFRFYLVFQHTTPKIEKEIVDYFVKSNNILWVTLIKGKFNLTVAI
jgi:Lrp/AsnC family leucine-responsive transcriptional regulator